MFSCFGTSSIHVPIFFCLFLNYHFVRSKYALIFSLDHSIITDPQIAVKFMAKQHKYERWKDFRLGSVFRQLFGHAAGTASGEAHKRIRSAFDPCYSTESVAQAVDMMEQECKQYLNQMVQHKQVLMYCFWCLITRRGITAFNICSDGVCHLMGSHFHHWIDYNGVAFRVSRRWSQIFGILVDKNISW